MKVTQITGERLVYLVSSDKPGCGPYQVDLLAHNGNGHCGCVNFGVVHWAKVKVGERSRCKHINLAREEFLNDLLKTIATEYESK